MFCALLGHLCFTGPRYQVSVYRTIGPLVCYSFRNLPYPLMTFQIVM